MKNKFKKILSVSMLVVLLTIVTRVLGFLREIIIAYKYGTSITVDNYVAAQTIGELIGNVIIVGALSTYVILFLNDKGTVYLKRIFIFALIFSLFLSGVIFINSKVIAQFLVINSTYLDVDVISNYILLLSPTIVLLGLASVLNSYLQFKGKFLQPILSIIFMNGIFIFSLLLLDSMSFFNKDNILPYSYLLSIIAYFLYSFMVTLITFYTNDLNQKEEKFEYASMMLILIEFFPILITTAINRLTLITDRIFAGGGQSGELAAFNYATKLINLPIAIIGTSLVNIMFVNFIKTKVEKGKLGSEYVRLLLIIGLIVTIFMCTFSELIVKNVYGYGEFSDESVKRTAVILQFLSLTIPLQFIMQFYLKATYGFLSNKEILKINLIGIICNIILNVIFITLIGIYGVAISTFLSLLIQIIMYSKCKLEDIVYSPKLLRTTLFLIILLFIGGFLKVIFTESLVSLILAFSLYSVGVLIIDKLLKLNTFKKVVELNETKFGN
ncbi:murein biosynthesis integral membrane protein MurJ [Peribacillus asahii]|uniref:murein biosynthesis integral membrane protein MurJ n=1 Tax=Peribacillus asahii TaxID=228899 RepID=UPI0037FD87A3